MHNYTVGGSNEINKYPMMQSRVGFMSSLVVWFLLLTLHGFSMCRPTPQTSSLPDISRLDEVEALIDFKNRLNDPKNALVSFDRSLVNACTWFHISCDDNSRVIRIDLGNAGLSGTISPELSKLPNLKHLNLYHNQLSGSMPKELGNLKNLVTLDLQSNKLTGPIPDEFGKLRSLETLRLDNNNLCGRAPVESLSHCHKLKVVVVYPNPRLCNPFKVLPKNCPPCA